MSDLCVATGDGFSSGIDTDVCYDADGLPLIPARRIKGCLREAALLLFGEEKANKNLYAPAGSDIARIFGVRGSRSAGSIVVGPATLRDGQGNALAVPAGIDRERVLALYTSQRASTAIDAEHERAKEDSLRFVRVVGKWDPVSIIDGDPKPLTFVSDIECDGRDFEVLEKSARALRALGFNRNRGLGAVSCVLTYVGKVGEGTSKALPRPTRHISITVRLDAPMMVTNSRGTEGLDYVPGSALYGFFASKLSGDPAFDDLFLRQRVRFSALYPVDDRGERSHPAPPFVVRVKGGLKDGALCTGDDFWSSKGQRLGLRGAGAVIKPLKGGFVDSSWHPISVTDEVIYHHSTGGDDSDPTLYTQRCLSAGTCLKGTIEADDPALMDKILGVLDASDRTLYMGRSKTAQYARVKVLSVDRDEVPKRLKVAKGDRIALLLDSDAMLKATGGQAPTLEALVSAINSSLGKDADALGQLDVCDATCAHPQTSLAYRTIGGYNAKWHQKRPQATAIAAGSAVVFTAKCDAALPQEITIGERQAEGFGRILCVNLKDVSCALERQTVGSKRYAEGKGAIPEGLSRVLEQDRRLEELLGKCANYTIGRKRFFSAKQLNPSFVGRLLRMAEESHAEDFAAKFDDRIESIKTKSKAKDARNLVGGLRECIGDVDGATERECMIYMLRMGKYLGKENPKAGGEHA